MKLNKVATFDYHKNLVIVYQVHEVIEPELTNALGEPQKFEVLLYQFLIYLQGSKGIYVLKDLESFIQLTGPGPLPRYVKITQAQYDNLAEHVPGLVDQGYIEAYKDYSPDFNNVTKET